SIDAETIASLKYYFQAKWSLNTNNTIIVHANGADFPYTAQQLRESPTLNAIVDRAWIILQFSFAFAFIIVTGVMTLIMRYFRKKGEEQTADCLVRGTRIATPDALAAQLKKDKNISTFSLDGLHLLPNNFEVRHIYMGGSTGTGKTVMIRKLLRWIRDRGDKAVIYDKGCTFVSRFYNPAT
ncbi:type IV secretion system DNA-binding domain-containing protein, partial [Photobacterium iliopiscarium]